MGDSMYCYPEKNIRDKESMFLSLKKNVHSKVAYNILISSDLDLRSLGRVSYSSPSPGKHILSTFFN